MNPSNPYQTVFGHNVNEHPQGGPGSLYTCAGRPRVSSSAATRSTTAMSISPVRSLRSTSSFKGRLSRRITASSCEGRIQRRTGFCVRGFEIHASPGKIDEVFTDLGATASVLPGPVAGLEVARIQSRIVSPCSDSTAVGFSTEDPKTPGGIATFPATQYLVPCHGP